MVPKVAFSILLVLLNIEILNAQVIKNEYITRNYDVSNGLPHNSIYRIDQDQFGFLWILMWDGVSRFDGEEFKNYFHDPNDSTTIPYFTPNDICIDYQNTVWITADHLSRYDRSTDRFIVYGPTRTNFISSENIFSITKDQSGILYAYGSNGISRYNYKTEHFEDIEMKFNKGNSLTFKCGDISVDDNNDFWICDFANNQMVQGKMEKPEMKRPTITFIKSFPFPFRQIRAGNFYRNTEVYSLRDGNYLIASNIGLYLVDAQNNKTIFQKSPETRVFKELQQDIL
ncbi:MAG: hypothetical protein WCI71_01695, partial [Bacteroidota bacterium]